MAVYETKWGNKIKSPSNELIDEEKYSLETYKSKKKKLEAKWIKLPSTLRFIEFLKHYIKEKFIQNLRNFKSQK